MFRLRLNFLTWPRIVSLPLIAMLIVCASYGVVSYLYDTFPSMKSVQAAASQASHGAIVVTSVFPGPDGLIGAVVHATHNDEQKNIIWFTPNLQAVVVNGHMVSAAGADLTQQAKYVQGLLLRPSEALAKTFTSSTRPILIGDAGPVVTVFFDPNCFYCHMLYQKLAPMVAAAKLRLRVVLVGVIKPSSGPRAASILMSADPVDALATNEKGFDVQRENGGMPIATPPSEPAGATAYTETKAAVDANTKVFTRTGASGTPTLLFCSRTSGQVKLMPGMPHDVDGLLRDAAPLAQCQS